MKIEEQITVNARPEKVWGLISDPRNAPRINTMVQEVTRIQGNGGIGTRWMAVAQIGGRMEIANEITEWEPNSHLSIHMDGPASGTLTFSLTTDGDTTVIREEATSDLPALTAPLVQPMLEQSITESLQRIKQIVEQE